MSRGKLPQSMQSRSRSLENCKSEEMSDNVEIIDLDTADTDDVVIIDVDEPGTSRQGSKYSKKRERGNSPNYVISIDDDDDDDETEDNDDEESGTNSHPRYGVSRNRYGLDLTSESESSTSGTSKSKESSDGEVSDCEILNDASGSIREDWERANSRKRSKLFEDPFDANLGEVIGSIYSTRLDKPGPSTSCNVPNRDEPNLDPFNGNEAGKEFENFTPSMFFEDEFKKQGDETKETKFEKPFSMNSCSDIKGKGIVNEDTGLKEDPFVEREKNEEPSRNVSSSPEKMKMEVESDKEARIDVVNAKEGPSAESFSKEDNEFPEKMVMEVNENVLRTVSEPEEHTCPPPVQSSDMLCVVDMTVESTGDDKTGEENYLFGDREKHKESDEYRRAVEAEWAARQEELRIQAEEAQKMKKRRKAESARRMRLLDMEKRQKQRLEEIRETQKKNEETMSQKEELRTEVRKELEIIERNYHDMASILRKLEIPVSGGISPLPAEIKAAYKQALLKFHPDRVQSTDIHMLVKAEETFKFISRLKQKLLPVA